MSTKILGNRGEEAAARYLAACRYQIKARQYRCPLGEIDLIATDRRYVAFVEVKLRKSSAFAEAREFVTRSKQRRIVAAAREWLSLNECEKQPRFDVAEIYAPQGSETASPEIRYWENAFSADE